jgi:ATP-dependent DNA ligase
VYRDCETQTSSYTEISLPLPTFTPADPRPLPEAFDHDDFIFELKMDGFRGLAYVDEHETRLVSRKGNVYKSFLDLSAAIHIDLDCQAILDGEIVVLDAAAGRSSTSSYGAAERPCSMRSMSSGWMVETSTRAR